MRRVQYLQNVIDMAHIFLFGQKIQTIKYEFISMLFIPDVYAVLYFTKDLAFSTNNIFDIAILSKFKFTNLMRLIKN